jgi:3-deoxy-7-phosphoheptulonate synthase
MNNNWTPSSWQTFPAVQQPQWPDNGALDNALKQIATFPPLVFAGEARSLQTALGQVASGNAFCYRPAIVQKALKSSAR